MGIGDRGFSKKKGFTLVELMIVVVIMAILVAVAVPVYIAVTDNVQKKTCNRNCRITSDILTHYINGVSSRDGEPKTIPDFEIHNEDGSPSFRAVGGGAPSAEISDVAAWLVLQYQDPQSSCCLKDGVITVVTVSQGESSYVRVTCDEHDS